MKTFRLLPALSRPLAAAAALALFACAPAGDAPPGAAAADATAAAEGADAAAAGLDWFPGHYVLAISNGLDPLDREVDRILEDIADRDAFVGVQVKYAWRDLEGPGQGEYHFGRLVEHLRRAKARGKKVFVQLQHKEFAGADAVPDYVKRQDRFRAPGTDVVGQFNEEEAKPGVTPVFHAMVWQPAVNARLNAMYAALGAAVAASGQAPTLAGVAVNETACEGGDPGAGRGRDDVGYDQATYVAALEAGMLALKRAFPRKVITQYTNFLPPNAAARGFITDLVTFARDKRMGSGGPDIRTVKNPGGGDTGGPFDPPSLDVFAAFKGQIPLSLSVQFPDYQAPETFATAYDRGVTEFGAQFMVWLNARAGQLNFTIDDVYRGVEAREAAAGFPNTARPTFR